MSSIGYKLGRMIKQADLSYENSGKPPVAPVPLRGNQSYSATDPNSSIPSYVMPKALGATQRITPEYAGSTVPTGRDLNYVLNTLPDIPHNGKRTFHPINKSYLQGAGDNQVSRMLSTVYGPDNVTRRTTFKTLEQKGYRPNTNYAASLFREAYARRGIDSPFNNVVDPEITTARSRALVGISPEGSPMQGNHPYRSAFSVGTAPTSELDREGIPRNALDYTMDTPLVGVHELEHVRQANPTPQDRTDSARLSKEFPAVLSELSHAGAVANQQLGPKATSEVLVPLAPGYGMNLHLMQDYAKRFGHLHGDKTMTELLNTPQGQMWAKSILDRYGNYE